MRRQRPNEDRPATGLRRLLRFIVGAAALIAWFCLGVTLLVVVPAALAGAFVLSVRVAVVGVAAAWLVLSVHSVRSRLRRRRRRRNLTLDQAGTAP